MIQDVTNSLIRHLDRVTKSTGKGMAVNSKGGYFLLLFGEMTGGEYERVMIDDHIGEAYYIRLKTGIVNENKSTGKRRGSCTVASQAQVQCRLVAMSHCQSIAVLAETFRNALNSYIELTISDINVRSSSFVRAIQYDFATIVEEETPEADRAEMSGWEGGMSIIAIDFDLNYTLEVCPEGTTNCC